MFKPGEIFVRTSGAATALAGPAEMGDIISRAVTKKSDDLLHSIRRVMAGERPPENPGWRTLFAPELTVWQKAEEAFRAKNGGGTFSVLVVPVGPTKPQARDFAALHTAVESSRVSLRGLDFPTELGARAVNASNRIELSVEAGRFKEQWMLFRTLLFGHIHVILEETGSLSQGGNVLDFVNAILTLGEVVLFAHRLLQAVSYQGEVLIQISLHRMKERRLAALVYPGVPFRDDRKCVEDHFEIEKRIHTTDLASGWEQVAADLAEELFAMFNWTNPGPQRGTILEWIGRLRDRKL